MRNTGKAIAISLSLAAFVIAGMLVAGGTAYGNNDIQATFNGLYFTTGTVLDSCTTCHTSVPAFNSYGQAIVDAGGRDADAGSAAIQAIEGDDSDGDTYANLAEIMALTFPGDNTSFPAQVGFGVTNVFPADNAVDVDAATTVVATFSERVDRTTVNDNTFFLNDGVDNVVGTFNFSADNTMVTFTPSAVLADNTLYTATLTTGISNIGMDNTLADNVVWSFTTGTAPVDNTAPTVVSAVPSLDNTATGVAVNAQISATFSEPVDPATVDNTSFIVTDASDNVVAGTVSISTDNTIATFTPAANFAYSATYKATLTTAITDFAANPLAGNVVWSFTIRPPSQSSDSGGSCSVIGSGGNGGGGALLFLALLAILVTLRFKVARARR